MKIGIISYICNSKSGARAPIDLAHSFRKAKNEVVFYAFDLDLDKETFNRLKKAGVSVTLTKKSDFPGIGFVFDFFHLYKLIKNSGCDVLNTHTPLPLFFSAYFSRIPIALSYHGTQFNIFDERYLEKNFILDLMNTIGNLVIYLKTLPPLRLAHQVIAISNYTKEEALRLFGRRAVKVYSGNAPGHFQKKALEEKKDKNYVTILSVSRITPYKQFEKIIETINTLSKQYRNIKLIIVGSSPQPRYLFYLKSLIKLNTRILINISDRELAQLYKNCDIYTTADKYLFFGMPILEAAVFGKPSVVFDYAAAREMIKHDRTGFVAINQTEFQTYLELLIENKILRNRMGERAKNWVKNFSWDKTARGYEKVFKKLL